MIRCRKNQKINIKIIGKSVFFYNGKTFLEFQIKENISQNKVGAFAFTRKKVKKYKK